MGKRITSISEQLQAYRLHLGISEEIMCSEEENQELIILLRNNQTLPEGVFQHRDSWNGNPTDKFFRATPPELSSEDRAEYLICKQIDLLMSIKGYLLFFVILTIVSIVGGLAFAIAIS